MKIPFNQRVKNTISKKVYIAVICCIIILCQGCVALFTPDTATVPVYTGSPTARLFVDDKEQEKKGDTVEIALRYTEKNVQYQLTVSEEGYLKRNRALLRTRTNPLFYVDMLGLGLPAIIDLMITRKYPLYERKVQLPNAQKIPLLKDTKYNVQLKYIEFDQGKPVSVDLKFKPWLDNREVKSFPNPYVKTPDFDLSETPYSVTQLFALMDKCQPEKKQPADSVAELYARVHGIKFFFLKGKRTHMNSALAAEVDATWTLKKKSGKTLSGRFTERSGTFALLVEKYYTVATKNNLTTHSFNISEQISYSVDEALQLTMVRFMENPGLQGFLSAP